MLKSRRFLLGVAFSAVLLGLFFWQVDIGLTASALRDAQYGWLAPAIGMYVVGVILRTIRWHVLLRHLKPVSPRRLFPVVLVGYMANNLLPVRLGELVRSFYLGQREGVSKSATLGTVLLERVFDGIGLLIIALIVWPFLPVTDVLRDFSSSIGLPLGLLLAAIIAPFGLIMALFFAVALSPRFGGKVVAFLVRLAPGRSKGPVEALLFRFVEGLESLRSPRRILAVLALTFPVWLAEGTMYWLVTFGFDLHLPFHGSLLTTSVSNLATSVPSTAGGVGPFEYAARVTTEGLGGTREVASAYAIVLHAALLAPVTLAGLFILWTHNLSLGDMVRRRGAPALEGYEAPTAGRVKP